MSTSHPIPRPFPSAFEPLHLLAFDPSNGGRRIAAGLAANTPDVILPEADAVDNPLPEGNLAPRSSVASKAMHAVIDLDQLQLDPALAPLWPRALAEKHRMIPLRQEDGCVTVALEAVTLSALDAARSATRCAEVLGVLASPAALSRAIERLYGAFSLAVTQPIRVEELASRLEGRPVALYGWEELAAKQLARHLHRGGHRSQIVTPSQVGFLSEQDVLVARIPQLEALVRKGVALRARIIAAGRTPDFDLPRAHELGAKGFLGTPLDAQQLLRAVRRCQAERPPPGLEAHGAA